MNKMEKEIADLAEKSMTTIGRTCAKISIQSKYKRITIVTINGEEEDEISYTGECDKEWPADHTRRQVEYALSLWNQQAVPSTITISVGYDCEQDVDQNVAEFFKNFRLTDNTTIGELKEGLCKFLTKERLWGQISNFEIAKELSNKLNSCLPIPHHFACYILPGSNDGFYIIINCVEDNQDKNARYKRFLPLFSLRLSSDSIEKAHTINRAVNNFFSEYSEYY
jgi:hypothetical protein